MGACLLKSKRSNEWYEAAKQLFPTLTQEEFRKVHADPFFAYRELKITATSFTKIKERIDASDDPVQIEQDLYRVADRMIIISSTSKAWEELYADSIAPRS